MKKILGILLVLVMLPALSWGSPFFTSDPQTDADYFEIQLDGVITRVSSEDMGIAGIKIEEDISDMTMGSHTVRARACNMWGTDNIDCSEWTPFLDFSRVQPGQPTGLNLVP